MRRLSTACWDRGEGLFFDASKQYTCLQSPWSPFAKYISHIPTAPFNTEKCKERLALRFLPTARREIHNDPLRTTWDLGGGGVGVGAWGDNACIVSFL